MTPSGFQAFKPRSQNLQFLHDGLCLALQRLAHRTVTLVLLKSWQFFTVMWHAISPPKHPLPATSCSSGLSSDVALLTQTQATQDTRSLLPAVQWHPTPTAPDTAPDIQSWLLLWARKSTE